MRSHTWRLFQYEINTHRVSCSRKRARRTTTTRTWRIKTNRRSSPVSFRKHASFSDDAVFFDFLGVSRRGWHITRVVHVYVLIKKNNTQTHRQRSVTQRDLFPPQKKNFFEIFSSLVTKRHTKRISVLERQRYARRIIRRTHTTKFSLARSLALRASLFSIAKHPQHSSQRVVFFILSFYSLLFPIWIISRPMYTAKDDGFYSLLFSKGLIIFQRQIRLQISASMYS